MERPETQGLELCAELRQTHLRRLRPDAQRLSLTDGALLGGFCRCWSTHRDRAGALRGLAFSVSVEKIDGDQAEDPVVTSLLRFVEEVKPAQPVGSCWPEQAVSRRKSAARVHVAGSVHAATAIASAMLRDTGTTIVKAPDYGEVRRRIQKPSAERPREPEKPPECGDRRGRLSSGNVRTVESTSEVPHSPCHDSRTTLLGKKRDPSDESGEWLRGRREWSGSEGRSAACIGEKEVVVRCGTFARKPGVSTRSSRRKLSAVPAGVVSMFEW